MLKTILKFSISSIVNLVMGFLSALILTRAFEPETYGILNIFNETVLIGLSILYLGCDSSFIRFYNEPPKNDSSKELGTKLLMICLSVTVIVGLVVSLFMSKWFTNTIFGFESRVICIMVFVSIFAQMVLRFLNIKYRMDFNTKAFTIQAILTQFCFKSLVIIAAVLSFPIVITISFNTMGIVLLAIVYLIIQRKNFFSFKNSFEFKSYNPVFLFALFSAPLAICLNLNVFVSQQMIAHIMDVSMVGIYSSTGVFAGILAALQGGFSTFWSAYMYKNYQDEQQMIKSVNEYLLMAIIVVYGLLIIFKDVIYIVIGPEYQSSKEFFSLTLAYPVFMLAAETTSYGINIKKKTYLSLICFFTSVIVNGILAFILIPIIGLKGAALASMISGLCLYTLKSVIGQKLYESISDLRTTVISIVFIVIMAVIPAFTSSIVTIISVICMIIITLLLNRKATIFVLRNCKALISRKKTGGL